MTMGNNKDIWDDIEAGLPAGGLEDEMFELVSAYSDGECSPKERRLVEAYLGQSEKGRSLIEDLRRTSASISQGNPEPPRWLRNAILEKTTQRKGNPWAKLSLRYLTPIAAAVTGLALYLGQPVSVQQPKSPIANLALPKVESPKNKPFIVRELTVAAQEPTPRTQRDKVIHAISAPVIALPATKVTVAKPAPPAIPKASKVEATPVRMGPEFSMSPKTSPRQPDAVSMIGDIEDNANSEEKAASKGDESITKLRERLKQVNSGAIDLGNTVHIPKGNR